jgi:uncharacterized protein (DUF2345 family)
MTIHSLALARKPQSASVAAADGARAELVDDGISVFDAAGHLLIRYEDGALTVRPAEGDLVLGSATGAVRISAASDVTIEAKRDVSVRAPRHVDLSAGKSQLSLDTKHVVADAETIELSAGRTSITGGAAEITVDKLALTAKEMVSRAERWEVAADNAVLRSREMLQEVKGALVQRLGRFRGIVEQAYTLRSDRTDMRSKGDTAIDGKRVLLG